MRAIWSLFALLLVLAAMVGPVAAQEPADEAAKPLTEEEQAKLLAQANNPLANMTAFNIQNYYYAERYGSDESANTAWLRFVKPFGRWLMRASLPLATVPTSTSNDPVSGLGDFNVFMAYLLSDPSSPAQFGVGPLVAMPTATDDALGVDAWQLGVAGVYFNAKSSVVQWGGLLTWQTSVSGDDDVNTAAIQPFVMIQLGKGTYLRSAPLWVFNFEADAYNVPLGLGIGKVVRVERTVFNMFIEPQWTMLHDGVGQPEFTIFAGLNLQFLPKK